MTRQEAYNNLCALVDRLSDEIVDKPKALNALNILYEKEIQVLPKEKYYQKKLFQG